MNIFRKLFKKFKIMLFPSKQEKIVKQFFKDGGETKLRYEYDLNEDSIVFDLGGYKGQWSSDIFSRYLPVIYIFEPVKSFYLIIKNRFIMNKKIKVYHYGVGSFNREEIITLQDDGSSTFLISGNKERIKIIDFIEFLKNNDIWRIDLIKINIEGGEYELLDAIIESGIVSNIINIQIQFHNNIKGAEERMYIIQSKLTKTHRLKYQYPFVWESWERKHVRE